MPGMILASPNLETRETGECRLRVEGGHSVRLLPVIDGEDNITPAMWTSVTNLVGMEDAGGATA